MPFDFFWCPRPNSSVRVRRALAHALRPYRETEPVGPRLRAWLQAPGKPTGRTIDVMVALNQRLHRDVGYVIRLEPGIPDLRRDARPWSSAPAATTGWLFVQILRTWGFAARFVSGYLIQLKPDEKSLDGPSGALQDFTDLHAWAEIYLPGAGWVGLDPTSGLLAGEGHIPLACTAEPSSAAPIDGLIDECETDFEFAMSVTASARIPALPCRTRDEQWTAIDALGREVDARLASSDVRLTMGGEPTFVSIDDRDGEEWNFTGTRTRQTPARRATRAPAPRSFRAARTPALRARASGTPASRCRAGRSAATGGSTASPCGTTRARCRRRNRLRRDVQRCGALRAHARAPARRRPWVHDRRASRTSGTTSGASAACR
jgi:hypothetical protein